MMANPTIDRLRVPHLAACKDAARLYRVVSAAQKRFADIQILGMANPRKVVRIQSAGSLGDAVKLALEKAPATGTAPVSCIPTRAQVVDNWHQSLGEPQAASIHGGRP